MSAAEATISYADLVVCANDTEIVAELPEGHVFEDRDVFLVHLATLIESQWGGKEGTILNNVNYSIFYLKVRHDSLAVFVFAGNREWHCDVSRISDVRWGAGPRVFSATVA